MHRGMVVWPGDPPFSDELWNDLGEGFEATMRRLSLSTHTGTHLDAPSHVIAEGGGVDSVPLSYLVGPVAVVDTGHVRCITQEDLERLLPDEVPPRILFKTRNSHRRLIDEPCFIEDFVALDPSAAQWLVNHGIKVVGIDYYSVDVFHSSGYPAHCILLQSGVAVIEAVRLVDVKPGVYRLIALPLKLLGMDGSPLRVILENLEKD